MDKSGDIYAIYAEVKNNPSKYPAITRIYDQIDNIPNLDETSKRDMFKSAYEMFKPEFRGKRLMTARKNGTKNLFQQALVSELSGLDRFLFLMLIWNLIYGAEIWFIESQHPYSAQIKFRKRKRLKNPCELWKTRRES